MKSTVKLRCKGGVSNAVESFILIPLGAKFGLGVKFSWDVEQIDEALWSCVCGLVMNNVAK